MLTDQKRSLEYSGLGTKGECGAFFDQQTVGEISLWKEENMMSMQKWGKIVEWQRHHLALWSA